MEQLRLIKEMRKATYATGFSNQSLPKPRYMVWENVTGATSTHGGRDFQAVLTETIRVAEPDAPDVPLPKKWPLADCYFGDGWSVAYRVMDAQYWGVPQRRRRIALVADFDGHTAAEILFERVGETRDPDTNAPDGCVGAVCGPEVQSLSESVSWDPAESGAQRERTSSGTGISVKGTDSVWPDVARSLIARADGSPCADRGPNIVCYAPLDSQSQRIYGKSGVYHSLNANENGGMQRDGVLTNSAVSICTMVATRWKSHRPDQGFGVGNPGDPAFTISAAHSHAVLTSKALSVNQNQCGEVRCGSVANTLSTNGNASGRNAPLVYDARGNGDGKTVSTLTGDHQNRVTDYTALAVCVGNGQLNQISMAEQSNTLDTMHDQQAVMVASVDCRNGTMSESTNGTLQAKPSGGQSLNLNNTCMIGPVVRRLTPLECERLQGYPDGWTVVDPITDMSDSELAFWQRVLFEKAVRETRVRFDQSTARKHRPLGLYHKPNTVGHTGIYAPGDCVRPTHCRQWSLKGESLGFSRGECQIVWKYVTPESKDYDPEHEADDNGCYWLNTGKPYKHKNKEQMVKWYNRTFCVDTDSARYRALGNSIALPQWKWICKRISAEYERDATLGSLFDGIGGFPLCWAQINGGLSVRWSSEIELYPIAVTNQRFGNEETGRHGDVWKFLT